MLVTCRPRSSIPRAQRTTTLTRLGRAQHRRVELLAPLGLHLLRVVQAGERAAVRARERLVVDQDRGGDQRPGQAAPPGLVGAGDLAAAEPAVEGEEAARAGQPALVRS